MFVGNDKGRQLARYIAWIYIILWILFIIFMIVRFNLNELFEIDLIIPLIITTIVDISLSLIIYISSYKIKNNNQLFKQTVLFERCHFFPFIVRYNSIHIISLQASIFISYKTLRETKRWIFKFCHFFNFLVF